MKPVTSVIELDADGTAWAVIPYDRMDDTVTDMADAYRKAQASEERSLLGIRYRVPVAQGSGLAHAIGLSPHLYLMLIDMEFIHERVIHVPADRMIKIRILLSGSLRATSNDIFIDGAGAYLESFPGDVPSSYGLAPGIPQRLLILMCDPQFFIDDIGLDAEHLPSELRYILDCYSGSPKASALRINSEVLRAANDIFRSKSHYNGRLYLTYLKAKVNEIACAIARDLARTKPTESKISLSVRDVNRVHEARDILADQFQRPPSIPKLARLVGLNQTKLKSAFKAVFNITVNDFTSQCRMERSAELLSTTTLSIAEVAYAVGYSYPANFTQAFRRFYNHTPRQLRQAVLHKLTTIGGSNPPDTNLSSFSEETRG